MSHSSSTHHSSGLLEAAPDALVVVTADGLITLVNAQAERLFEYDRAELVGRPVEILVPEAARESHPAHRAAYLRDPRPRSMAAGMTLAGRRKGGGEFPAEISLSAIETEEGQLVVVAVRDVTEHRHAAAAQARLASIVQSSQDAIMGLTPGGMITSWNPAAERIYGYPAEEIIGENVTVLSPGQSEHERAVLRRVTAGAPVERYRTTRVRKDGSPVQVSVSVSPIVSDGSLSGLACTSRDLTEQELAEAKFRDLLEAAPDAIVGVAEDDTIVLANAQAEKLFGYHRTELLGKPVELVVPAGVRGDTTGRRLTARRRDGSEFPAEMSLSAIQTEDGPVVSAAIRDVTERLEAQAERERLMAQAERERLRTRLEQSQRLESLGQLAGGVAHDFNNLLAVILNYTAFVSEEVSDAQLTDPDRWLPVARDVAQIERAAHRAIALTHQLLAFGRQEVVRPEVLDLNRVVADVRELLDRSIGEHVRLATAPAEGLWPIKADPGQLEQVLVNLAVNARDAMPGGGTLTISTGNREAGETDPVPAGRYVQLRVSDTGVGMPPEVIGRAFEPFYTTKPKGEGTGLGLATVHGIIAQAGGHTQITSMPGQGTTVSMLIPATDEQATPADEAPEPARPAGGETILVVEDEDAMREVTRRILARHGYQVLTAPGGEQALRLLSTTGPIDLLLTDVIMARMLGKDVADRVRGQRPGVRVLYMSGYARPVLADRGTLDDGVSLVAKPFSEATLLTAVRQVLDGTVD